ncbi:hypothetical protein CALVIDRAFT_53276 [Calocera viscosa TUFC12733]|uniref:Uncharacterized protein n=1 Tax=Calocera viscosa (strain TUFC12733) TaxID=1330018 RepID=A0A167NU89_CALVF|nr:hypothetical protein CALVIDRAFT_53276 [Calocera viscosa TUFC12733]
MSTVLTPTPPGVLSPVQQPEVYAPLQTIEGLILPLPDEYAMNLVLRSPASSDSGRDATVAAWAEGSPYPSRPDSALSTPRSSLSLPSTAGGDSWTDGDRGSDVLSEELLSLSSRDGFGTDDEEDGAASELGSVSDLGNV